MNRDSSGTAGWNMMNHRGSFPMNAAQQQQQQQYQNNGGFNTIEPYSKGVSLLNQDALGP